MISLQWSKIRSGLSTWFIGVFSILIISAAIISELFQASPIDDRLSSLYLNPIDSKLFSNINSLLFKNKFGQFLFERELINDSHTNYSQWRLHSPRELPAKNNVLHSLFKALGQIKVKKIHQYEPINISSFSLDNPLVNLELNTPNETIKIHFGLINPIDNSAYMSIVGRKTIYQIESLKFPLESFDLTSFVESKIFHIPIEQITKVSVFKQKRNSATLELIKKGAIWTDDKAREISTERVKDFLTELTKIRSQIILDRQNDKVKEQITSEKENPIYTVEVEMGKISKKYVITNPIKSISDYKIESKKNILIFSSEEKHPYVVKRDILKFFEIKPKDLRGPSIKKIFY